MPAAASRRRSQALHGIRRLVPGQSARPKPLATEEPHRQVERMEGLSEALDRVAEQTLFSGVVDNTDVFFLTMQAVLGGVK